MRGFRLWPMSHDLYSTRQLSTFCLVDPNSVGVEDEALRGKVMVAIHAARAAVLAGGALEEHLHPQVGRSPFSEHCTRIHLLATINYIWWEEVPSFAQRLL